MSSSPSSSSPAKAFEKLMFDTKDGVCVKANSFGELKKLFHSRGAHSIVTQQLLYLPLASPLSETATVLSCCHPDIERVRKLISRFSDMKILMMTCIAEEIQRHVDDRDKKDDSAAAETTVHNNKNKISNSGVSSNASAGKESGVRRSRPIIISGDESSSFFSSSSSSSRPNLRGSEQQHQRRLVNFFSNVIGLLYGLVFPANTTQPVACSALVEEKEIIEKSEQYASSNAAERRKATQHSVLCVFSDRGQRFCFSRVWTNVLQEVLSYRSGFTDQADVAGPSSSSFSASLKSASSSTSPFGTSMHILSLHLLTDINSSIIPWLTNPLLLSETLTEAYRDGGLLAVLALEGLLTLIVSHGLEYPKFYSGLYALVTPDIFSSPHRNRFFRLLHLALTSVRVSGAVAASFIKRLARCALICPSPALYFVLPFIRQKLQQHKNCFALIHRSLRDVDEEEAEVEKQKKKMTFFSANNNNNSTSKDQLQLHNQIDHVERLKKLFEGIDCYDAKQPDPEKTNAVDSTLWEIAALERHSLPAVRNAVAAFASPAEDNQVLQFERSYARLFAHSMSMTETTSSACTVVPPSNGASVQQYDSNNNNNNNNSNNKSVPVAVTMGKSFFNY